MPTRQKTTGKQNEIYCLFDERQVLIGKEKTLLLGIFQMWQYAQSY